MSVIEELQLIKIKKKLTDELDEKSGYGYVCHKKCIEKLDDIKNIIDFLESKGWEVEIELSGHFFYDSFPVKLRPKKGNVVSFIQWNVYYDVDSYRPIVEPKITRISLNTHSFGDARKLPKGKKLLIQKLFLNGLKNTMRVKLPIKKTKLTENTFGVSLKIFAKSMGLPYVQIIL